MLVLHGNWIIGSEEMGTESVFILWAEDIRYYFNSEKNQGHIHPYVAPCSDLRRYVRNLGLKGKMPSFEMEMCMPTLYGKPKPSDTLVEEFDLTRYRRAGQPLYWEIIGIELTPWQFVQLVMGGGLSEDGYVAVPGSDLIYWNNVVLSVLELVANQYYIPKLLKRGSTIKAIWQPYLSHDWCKQRLELLARTMPTMCRAVTGPFDEFYNSLEILVSVWETLVDLIVRQMIVQIPVKRGRLGYSSPQGRVMLWALAGKDSISNVLPEFAADMAYSLDSWLQSPDSWVAGKNDFNTCLRLVAPDNHEDDWELEYYLQAKDDPSLLVPATVVLSSESGSEYLHRRFAQAQDKLLLDLGLAVYIFPPLEKSLQQSSPDRCLLTVAEAHEFLTRAAMLMEDVGIVVQLPSFWLDREKQKPRLRVKTKSPDSVGEHSFFSMQALMEYDWELALGDEVINSEEFNQLADLKQPLVQVRGQWVEMNPHHIKKYMDRFKKENQQGMTLGDTVKLSLGGDEQFPDIEVQPDGALRDFLKNLQTGTPKLLDQPQAMAGTLRPYQQQGFSWLAFLTSAGLGACLADDMGLGKTIQLIALLLHRGEAGSSDACLLICPTSVLGNWQRELTRFAPEMKVLLHHGPDRLTGTDLTKQVAKYHLVITSYALAARDVMGLGEVDWQGVILDEAQNIKNPHTKQTRSIRQLKAGFRVALTGTPVENRLSELWSVMEFLNSGFLGSVQKFRSRFSTPIEKRGDRQATEQLRRLVSPFILRRLKSDPEIVPDLPEKLELPVYCNLTGEQATLYDAVLRDMMNKINSSDGMERRGLILATLTKLKQVCNHPVLLLADGSRLDGRSGKLARLVEMLEEVVSADERVLIFTQYAAMGKLLCNYLKATFDSEPFFLHGGVPRKERDRMVEQFQSDSGGPPFFVLTVKAGGVGLNLTGASHVIHYDRWWNPAVENQATDRAYRIGQLKNVMVHKFICSGTLEERIDEMINSKKELADKIVTSGEGWLTELGNEELKDVFALRNITIGD